MHELGKVWVVEGGQFEQQVAGKERIKLNSPSFTPLICHLQVFYICKKVNWE